MVVVTVLGVLVTVLTVLCSVAAVFFFYFDHCVVIIHGNHVNKLNYAADVPETIRY